MFSFINRYFEVEIRYIENLDGDSSPIDEDVLSSASTSKRSNIKLTIMSGGFDMLLIKATKHGVIFSSAYHTGCCLTCAGCR